MYLDFFGFQRPPFELVPDPDFLFLGESHESAMANLAMGLEAGKGFVVITGPVGAGKTTILRAMLRRLGREQNICFLTQPEADIRDLLRAILDGFHQPVDGLDLADLRRALRDHLGQAERPGILIVDEAHLIAEESLEQLRLLSNLEDDHRKLLQIVLSGQRELKELLARPRLRPLAQRIEMFYEIEPLSPDETAAYIDRRIRIAGNPDGLVFQEDALRSIHEITGGIPRLINILADRTLITAYVEDSRTLSASTVREAWEDLGEVTQSVMTGRPPAARGRGAGRTKAPKPPKPQKAAKAAPELKPLPHTTRPLDPASPFPATPLPEYDPASSYPPPPPLPPREIAAVAPARVGTPRSGEASARMRERWLAAAGLAIVALLAVTSLSGGMARTDRADAEPVLDEIAGEPATAAPRAPSIASEATAPDVPDPEASADEARAAGASDAGEEHLAVQAASFRDLAKAREFAARIDQDLGVPTRVSPAEMESGLWYRVLAGECTGETETRELTLDLRARYDLAFLRTVRITSSGAEDTAEGRSP